MKVEKNYWCDFTEVSISISNKQYVKILNCLEDNKIQHEIKKEISYRENEETRIEVISLCIEICWATLLTTKLAEI